MISSIDQRHPEQETVAGPLQRQPALTNDWPHRVAVVLVCATFPLIWVGGLVTTYDAGMAVVDWPTTYGYNLFLYPLSTWITGPWDLFIEHGHRLLGATVGLLTVVLTVAVWIADRRPWMRMAMIGAVLAVIAQGVIGGIRVRMDAVDIARIHACTGPLFFAITIALAVCTSRRWLQRHPYLELKDAKPIHMLVWLGPLLSFAQIVLGAQLRHMSPASDPYVMRIFVFFHVFVALVIVLYSALLVVRVRGTRKSCSAVFRPAVGLAGLVVVQLVLGASAWVLKYSWPTWAPQVDWFVGRTIEAEGLLQSLTVTAHVATGSLILAVSVTVLLRTLRLVRPLGDSIVGQQQTLEAVG